MIGGVNVILFAFIAMVMLNVAGGYYVAVRIQTINWKEFFQAVAVVLLIYLSATLGMAFLSLLDAEMIGNMTIGLIVNVFILGTGMFLFHVRDQSRR